MRRAEFLDGDRRRRPIGKGQLDGRIRGLPGRAVSPPLHVSHLRAAGKKLDELETASEEGDVIIAPPSTWLLTPPRDDDSESRSSAFA